MKTTYQIEGKWYVLYSNFPMWLKGDKTDPSFVYGKPVNGAFSDTVVYTKNGKVKRLKGVDTVKDDHLVWRGRGVLRIARSVWRIIHFDGENG